MSGTGWTKWMLPAAGVLALVLAAGLYLNPHAGADAAPIRSEARSGASEAALIAMVEKADKPYRLSADDVIGLKNDGVPEPVIVKMLRHKR